MSLRKKYVPERHIETSWAKEGSGVTGDLIHAIERAKRITENTGKILKRNRDSREALMMLMLPRDMGQIKEEMSGWRMKYLVEGDKIDADIENYTRKHNGSQLAPGFSDLRLDPLTDEEELGLASPKKEISKWLPHPQADHAAEEADMREQFERKTSSMQKTLGESGEEQKRRWRRIKQALRKLAGTFAIIKTLMRATGLPPKKSAELDLIEKAFPARPFQSEHASEFFNTVTQGDLTNIRVMLNKNRFLVYDFDYVGRTALHVAARKNHVEVMKELLGRLADPNATDISGRTPLYVAAKYASITAVKLLLEHKANPTYITRGNLTPLDVAHTHLIKKVLKIAVKVYKEMMLFISKDKREGTWRHVCTLNFMPSNNDQNDFELDAIPETLRKALDRGKS